jgi:RNA polymerase sigma-70 factor, ECF subfamily
MKTDDKTLIAKVLIENDNHAFELLVKKYQSLIRRYFLHQTLDDEALSDDLAQDTFIKAYTNLAKFQSLSSFSTWLYRIAYNTLCDHIRKKEIMESYNKNIAANINIQVYDISKDIEQKYDVFNALQILKENERTCITLFYMEDLSLEIISEITEMPQNTVKSHLTRGKTKMAEWLKNKGYGRN